MKEWKAKVFAVIIGIFSLSTVAQSVSDGASKADKLQEQYKAHFELQKRINFELAKIKTKEALIAASKDEPTLKSLSQSALTRFVRSAKFNENGLVSFDYLPLEAELTPTKIYEFLSLFGKQHISYMMTNARVESATDTLILNSAPHITSQSVSDPISTPNIRADHRDYECVSRATCQYTPNFICMSGC